MATKSLTKTKKPTAAELRLAAIPEEERWKYSKFGKPLSKETLRQRAMAEQIRAEFEKPMFAEQLPRIYSPDKHEWRTVAFILPMPPSINQWMRTWKGKARVSEIGKTYMECAHEVFKSMGLWKPSIRKLKIEIKLRGLPKGSDIDGRNKQLMDSMQGTIVHNDYQFRSMLCEEDDLLPTDDKGDSYVHVFITWWKEN